MEFGYDVIGNRISKTVDADGDGSGSANTTKFAYDINGNAWVDFTGTNTVVGRHIFGAGQDALIAKIVSGTTNWYGQDIIGSTRDLFGPTGSLIDHLDYSVFGKKTYESASGSDRYLWTSREYDAEIDLQYNRARYYDQNTGRWISQDPLGLDAGDSNLYRYVNNRPTGATDPSGLSEVTIFADAFIPQKEVHDPSPRITLFSRYFKGDNRSVSKTPPALGRTRIANWITVEVLESVRKNPLVAKGNHASESTAFYYAERRDTKVLAFTEKQDNSLNNPVESVRRINANMVEVTLTNAGSNSIALFGPDIDYTWKFTITETKGGIVVTGNGKHDRFPGYELYVNKTQVWSHDPRANGDTPFALFGISQREASFQATITKNRVENNIFYPERQNDKKIGPPPSRLTNPPSDTGTPTGWSGDKSNKRPGGPYQPK